MKLRTWAKRALLGLLSAGSGAIIAACYGPIDDGNYHASRFELIEGRVTDGARQGISGLQVCARFDELNSKCETTGADGTYRLSGDEQYWDSARQQGFLLSVRDEDGEQNGSWTAWDQEITPEQAQQLPLSMDITVTPVR